MILEKMNKLNHKGILDFTVTILAGFSYAVWFSELSNKIRWIELCVAGLVYCGAAGPSVFIDSDTEALILFPDKGQ